MELVTPVKNVRIAEAPVMGLAPTDTACAVFVSIPDVF